MMMVGTTMIMMKTTTMTGMLIRIKTAMEIIITKIIGVIKFAGPYPDFDCSVCGH
jgi:hypothetical protein